MHTKRVIFVNQDMSVLDTSCCDAFTQIELSDFPAIISIQEHDDTITIMVNNSGIIKSIIDRLIHKGNYSLTEQFL